MGEHSPTAEQYNLFFSECISVLRYHLRSNAHISPRTTARLTLTAEGKGRLVLFARCGDILAPVRSVGDGKGCPLWGWPALDRQPSARK